MRYPLSSLWRMVFAAAVLAFSVLALLPAEQLPPLSVFDWWDKAQHALAFAALAVLARLGWMQAPVWRLAAALVAFGGLIELAQASIGWRHGEMADVLADAVGVGLGLLVAVGWPSLRLQLRQ